ncbi:MAG: glycine cleavage system protein H [Streptosporangiaceae bacterium]
MELGLVAGYPVALDRCYQPDSHMWVLPAGAGVVTIGMDALAVQTSGSLAELSLPGPGETVRAGAPFGQLEAAKFVGPLVSPVTGTVLAVNDAVAADPGLAEDDPYGDGWLIQVAVTGKPTPALLTDPVAIREWFAARVTDYRDQGVLAE